MLLAAVARAWLDRSSRHAASASEVGMADYSFPLFRSLYRNPARGSLVLAAKAHASLGVLAWSIGTYT